MKLSLVVPLLNEEMLVPELYRRVTSAMSFWPGQYEVVVVNDGSVDRTLDILMRYREHDSRWKILDLSRNFGHQNAYTCGIDHAEGDAVILMDGDLQDPPELIREMVDKWRQGYQVVFGVKQSRKEAWPKRAAFGLFYRILNVFSSFPMPLDAGVFSLMDRQVVDHLRALPERNRYIAGLRAWVGFRQTSIEYHRDQRYAGTSRQTLRRLFHLAMDALFSFSYVPLRIATFMGLVSGMCSFLILGRVLYFRLFTDKAILGWASVMVAVTFIGGMILVTLGLIGEYIGRIYDEAKKRPHYILRRRYGFEKAKEVLPIDGIDRL